MLEAGFKMPHEFALSIGESFAELLGFSANAREPFLRHRWYLPKKSLADGLKESLKGLDPAIVDARLRVSSSAVERILAFNQGRSPAILVSSGFENRVRLAEDSFGPRFSFQAERPNAIFEDDFVFGVSGRIATDGSERTPLALDELEQVAAKLELLKTKDVALALLNSPRNPMHEKNAAEYLRARGLRVVMSHEMPGATEDARLKETIEAAFAESAVLEEKEAIDGAIKALGGNWTCEIQGLNGLRSWDHYSSRWIRGGPRAALSAHATQITYHCGLDGFEVLRAAKALPLLNRGARPTQLIEHGAWPFPHLSEKASGYAPGPMLFGRSQMLAALDVLFVCDRLTEIPGLTPLVNEKTRARILEALFTLAKSSTPSKRPPDPLAVAKSLERAFVELAIADLNLAAASGEILLTGALAEVMKPRLQERRPDLVFRFNAEDAWREGQALQFAEERA